jgi:hypothetical protein
MFTSASASNDPLPPAAAPVRSPRTSIILAELARQRRLERRQRRLRRQRRRQAWARCMGWLAALGVRRFEPIGAPVAAGLIFVGAMPLVYAMHA